MRTPSKMRIPELVVTALAVAAAAVWVGALVTSLPPPAPVIVVQGEAAVDTNGVDIQGAPWAVRFVAVAPGGSAPLEVTGTVRLGDDTAPIEYGTARIEHARPGLATFDVVVGGLHGGPVHGTYELVATDGTDGRRDRAQRSVDGASLEGTAPANRAVAPVRWTPWYGEVAMRSAATSPVYPLDGRVSAGLDSHVVLLELEAGKTSVVMLRPRASGAALDDGRVLQVDRSGLRLEGVLELEGRDVFANVHATEERRVACDLLVDGVVHDAVNVDINKAHLSQRAPKPTSAGPTEAATSYRRNVELRMGLTRADALVVVHCGGVYGTDVGRVALMRAAPTGQLAPWLRDLARRGGAPDDEPLLALDDNALSDPYVARAALARMSPAKVRAPRLDVAWTVERGPSATLRLVYAALAIAVVVAVLALGLVRTSERRGTVIFGVAALAAVLAGLFAALVVVAAGG